MENTTNNAAAVDLNLEAAAPYFEKLGEAGSAVLYKICAPEATPADIAAALHQKLDRDGKPRSTDIRISGVAQLIQAGFIVTAAVPEGGLKPVTVRRFGGTAAAVTAAVTAAKAEAEAVKAEAEAAALATVTAAAYKVLEATNGNTAALAGMPEAAITAAVERWEAAVTEKRNAENAAAAAMLAECAAAAGVPAEGLLVWIKARAEAEAEAVKTEGKKGKKA